MKKGLLFIATLFTGFGFAQDCSDLFISEYVEGWSNNKALEIYNPTNTTIDLSQYIVIRYSNGATSATSDYAVQLTGTIAPYGVYVGVVDKQDPLGTGNEAPVWDSLAARADGWYSPDYNVNSTWYWNGNDAVVLAKGTVANLQNAILVDVFGKIGENPGNGSDPLGGWTANFPYVQAGDGVTVDHSMIRKPTVLKGVTNPTISFFNPLAEYDSIPAVVDIAGQLYGNWFSLGTHVCGCTPAGIKEIDKSVVSVFPNTTNGEFYIKGIEDYTSLIISNSLGQVVETIYNNSKPVISVNLGEKRGVYFVRLVNNAGEVLTKRVIVK